MTDCIRGCAWVDERGREWPSEAMVGNLCAWCYQRLGDHLAMAAPVAVLMRELATPGVSVRGVSDRVQVSFESRVPFRVDAAECAELVMSVVWGWAAECHRLTGIGAPDVIRDLVDADREPGRLGAAGGRDAGGVVAIAAGWLLRHVESIAYLDVVGVLHDEVVGAVRRGVRVAGLVPLRERPVKRGCPVCGEREVVVRYVTAERVPTGRVECRFCGWSAEQWSAVAWIETEG